MKALIIVIVLAAIGINAVIIVLDAATAQFESHLELTDTQEDQS